MVEDEGALHVEKAECRNTKIPWTSPPLFYIDSFTTLITIISQQLQQCGKQYD